MPTSADPIYLDSSALVKRVIHEPESDALEAFLARRSLLVSCRLVRTEVPRAVLPSGLDAVVRARTAVAALHHVIELDDLLLDRAAALGPPVLRTLDAIHLAAALDLLPAGGEVLTYDRRMQEAARGLGFTVRAPGQTAA